MNAWRHELDGVLCDQDRLILDLFKNKTVKYIGDDPEFAAHLNCIDTADNVVMTFNQPCWLSTVVTTVKEHLQEPVDNFYIGINRYLVLGNDTQYTVEVTGNHGADLLNFIEVVVRELGYYGNKHSTFDADLGRYFNFIQPLTWMHGSKIAR